MGVALELPEPRADGLCAQCKCRNAKTQDGRFCRPCLRGLVCRLSPGPVNHHRSRPAEAREAPEWEPSPWRENAVRALEGD